MLYSSITKWGKWEYVGFKCFLRVEDIKEIHMNFYFTIDMYISVIYHRNCIRPSEYTNYIGCKQFIKYSSYNNEKSRMKIYNLLPFRIYHHLSLLSFSPLFGCNGLLIS